MVLGLPLLAACAPAPAPEVVFGTESTCWNEFRPDTPLPPSLACAVPTDWTPTPDNERLVAIELVGDLTRDGRDDALFTFADAGLTGDQIMRAERVIPSPLLAAVDDPTGSIAELRFPADSPGILASEDLDGDGRTDLLVQHTSTCGATTHAVLAPFEGVVPYWEAPAYEGEPIDVDGNVRFEQQRLVDGAVEIRPAHPAAWHEPPCLVVAPSCLVPRPISMFDGWTTTAPWTEWARAWPDLDGDGVRELWVGGPGEGCGGFLFPASVTGTYDPNRAEDAVRNIDPLAVIDDQSGDGLADVVDGDEVLLGPFAFTNGAVTPNERRVPAVQASPLGIDLDGDGFGEWATPEVDGAVDVYTGGPNGGLWSGERRWRVWVNQAIDVDWLVEDGVAYVLLVLPTGTLKILEVGPAAVVSTGLR